MVDLEQQLHDAPRRVGVEVAGGLVGEEDPRPVHQGTGDRHALLLTAAQLIGKLVELVLEPDDPERLLDLLAQVALAGAGHLQREGDVLRHRAPAEQLVVLEDDAELAAQLGQLAMRHPAHLLAVDEDAPGGRRLVADEQSHQGRLAGSAGADQKQKSP